MKWGSEDHDLDNQRRETSTCISYNANSILRSDFVIFSTNPQGEEPLHMDCTRLSEYSATVRIWKSSLPSVTFPFCLLNLNSTQITPDDEQCQQPLPIKSSLLISLYSFGHILLTPALDNFLPCFSPRIRLY
jgi:hypothetical protein